MPNKAPVSKGFQNLSKQKAGKESCEGGVRGGFLEAEFELDL